MISYYTSIILLSWLALGVLYVLVWENDRLNAADKRMLYVTYALVALSALAEWLGIRLSGSETVSVRALRAIKSADYILTPIAGGALAAQLRTRSIWQKLLFALLAVNTVFQLVSFFKGWMVRVDNHNYYTHGPLYIVYIVFYLAVIALIIIEFSVYGKRFRRRNRKSLYAILFLVIAGIMMQELLGGEIRTAYITLTLGMSMMFIHYAEFSQLAADDALNEQRILITTDALTGVSSRHAYARALKDLEGAERLPDGLAVFSVDINGLKETNDTLGHEAGDELICAAASCIVSALGSQGTCYRTGGDEFIVLAEADRETVEASLSVLRQAASEWCGKKVQQLHLAAGYALAADHPEMNAEKLIQEADKAMYEAKAAYYSQSGTDRRKNR